MKAALIARYGSPGVIEVRDVPAPVPGPDEVLVRVHAATVNRTDCGELLHPALIGLLTGAAVAAKDPRHGFRRNCRSRWRGGRPVQARRPRVRNVPVQQGRRPGGIFLHARNRADRAHAGESALRSGGHLRRRLLRECRPSSSSAPEARPQDPDLRRVGRDRHGRASARQDARRRGDRGRGRPPPRPGPVARRRPGDRLCHRRVRPAWPRLRFRVGRGGKAGHPPMAAMAQARGRLRGDGSRPQGAESVFLLWSKLTGNGRVVVPLPKRGSGRHSWPI